MAGENPDEQQILEIIDQRRPATHPAKYIVLGVVALAFIVGGYLLLAQWTPRKLADAAVSPLEKGAALTNRFLQHLGTFLTSSHASTSSEVEIGRVTAADKLAPMIVAKQDLVLKFTHVDEHIFGTSTAEVRALGKAFYYVPLLGPQATWTLDEQTKGNLRVCVVRAPALRVLLPVNVDTRSMEIRTKTGLLRTNQQEMTAAALADITPRLNHEALMNEVSARAAARKTITAFVKSWLEGQGSWGQGKFTAIQVLFPGENSTQVDLGLSGAEVFK